MLKIAQKNNLAETAFVKPRTDGTWDLRWFAPAHEVGFCGHATLATAHFLFTQYGAQETLVFHTKVGDLRASKVSTECRLDLPRLAAEVIDTLPPQIEGIFAVSPVAIFRNFENIFADLGTAEAVRAFIPDLEAIARLGAMGLVVTRREARAQRTLSRATSPPARATRKTPSPARSTQPSCLIGPKVGL